MKRPRLRTGPKLLRIDILQRDGGGIVGGWPPYSKKSAGNADNYRDNEYDKSHYEITAMTLPERSQKGPPAYMDFPTFGDLRALSRNNMIEGRSSSILSTNVIISHCA